MVHCRMRNGSRVADEDVYKERLLGLEDFILFSVYMFSCGAQQVQLRNSSNACLVLIPLISTLIILFRFRYHIIVTNTTCASDCPHPLH